MYVAKNTLRGARIETGAAVAAPVRAVEVGGKAANFAQAEFISAEHFNRKGSHAVADRVGIA